MFLLTRLKSILPIFGPAHFFIIRFFGNCSTGNLSLLQLDANLIEGEPYNCLARKNKRRVNEVWQNSNILEMWETGFKNPPRRTASVWGPVQCQQHTDFFTPAHSPVGQKTSRVNLKRKIATSANYSIQMALVQDIRLTTKKYDCMVKDLHWCRDET